MFDSLYKDSLFAILGLALAGALGAGCGGTGEGLPGPVALDSGACVLCTTDAGSPPPPPPPSRRDAGTCSPRTCEPGECGVVDNGCGGTMHCGSCACEPRTCEEAGARCGTTDDGCGRGGTIDCNFPGCPEGSRCEGNLCVCDPDMSESNDDRSTAPNLGEVREGEADTAIELTALNLHTATDEDWFRARVVDTYDFGNPEVIVSVTGDSVDAEVTLFYECDDGGDAHDACSGGLPYLEGMLQGCQGSAGIPLHLGVECAGIDETGEAIIRVRHATGSSGSCDLYTLQIRAE